MRMSVMSVAALVCAGLVPASANQIKVTYDNFEIYGGLGNSPTKQSRSHYQGMRTVDFETDLPSGSIVVKTYARSLYYILPGGRAIEYGVGVGREGFTWSGKDKV